jgi:hypothetical protein
MSKSQKNKLQRDKSQDEMPALNAADVFRDGERRERIGSGGGAARPKLWRRG